VSPRVLRVGARGRRIRAGRQMTTRLSKYFSSDWNKDILLAYYRIPMFGCPFVCVCECACVSVPAIHVCMCVCPNWIWFIEIWYFPWYECCKSSKHEQEEVHWGKMLHYQLRSQLNSQRKSPQKDMWCIV